MGICSSPALPGAQWLNKAKYKSGSLSYSSEQLILAWLVITCGKSLLHYHLNKLYIDTVLGNSILNKTIWKINKKVSYNELIPSAKLGCHRSCTWTVYSECIVLYTESVTVASTTLPPCSLKTSQTKSYLNSVSPSTVKSFQISLCNWINYI